MLRIVGQIFATRRIDAIKERLRAAGLNETQIAAAMPTIFGEVAAAHTSGLERAIEAAKTLQPTVHIVLGQAAEDIGNAAPAAAPKKGSSN